MSEVCRSCKAPIVWARTAKGTAIPLDREPSEIGNIRLLDGIAKVIPADSRQGLRGRLYVSHFATCPFAREWSGKRRSKPNQEV